MANNVQELNYEEILTLIQGQLMEHMNSEEYFAKYKGTKLILSKEQQFMKLKDKDPNAIYIVVRFGAADVMFRQTVLPVTILVLTQHNKVDLAYDLMYEYSQRFNLVRANNDTIQQVYESPSMSGSFNEVYEGFRSVVTMTAAFVIGKNSNEYKVYYYYTEGGMNFAEEIPLISTSFSYVGSPDTQAFYNSNNFARSAISFGAVSLGFTTFVLSDSKLINEVLNILGNANNDEQAYVFEGGEEKVLMPSISGSEDINNHDSIKGKGKAELENIVVINTSNREVWRMSSYSKGVASWRYDHTLAPVVAESIVCEDYPVNKTFKLGVVYKDKKHARIRDYKLTTANGAQDIGQIPRISLAFTE